jgi:nifR3 family TIM-barrel protein
MKNFWQKIAGQEKPFFCLAPMADVTDAPFRKIIAKYSRHDGRPKHGVSGKGGPDVFWTEFVSADGLASEKGRKRLLNDLKFSRGEKPIVAQIFGSHPENIEVACRLIAKLGFDGIDLNMGCPDRKVEKQGAGSAMIKNPSVAREVIRAAIKGAGKLPVSVKTRIGFNKIEYKEWLGEILKEDISALTIHLRTRKELSNVPAHWELAKEIVKFVRTQKKDLILIGNGDVSSLAEGKAYAKKSGFDGIMIGRGVFGNPWLFDRNRNQGPSLALEGESLISKISVKEKLKALLEHTKLFEKTLLHHKRFDVMKKHFKAYVCGFDGAKELRVKLMATNSSKEVASIIKSFQNTAR